MEDGPAGPVRPQAAPTDAAAAREANENIKKAKEAFSQGNIITGYEFAHAAASSQGASEALKRMAQDLLTNNQAAYEQALKDRAARMERRLMQMQLNFGPDLDPIWVTDTSVIPGKSYRYKLRLIAINPYAGLPSYLVNPEDATKVVVPGQWSEWSEPITAKPNKQLFAYQMDQGNQAVRYELSEWKGGKWLSGSGKAGVGEPIIAKFGSTPLTYDATITNLDANRQYRARNSKTAQYDPPKPTFAVVLVNAAGEVDERLVAEDEELRNAFNQKKNWEKSRAEELSELSPQIQIPVMNMAGQGMPTPTPMGMEDMPPGPGGYPPGPGGFPPGDGRFR
jgi:hypothetical protein